MSKATKTEAARKTVVVKKTVTAKKTATAGNTVTKKRARPKKTVPEKASTEEKIKAAAKKLFTQKGFAATRTRDIAEEAGLNLALLNYYFRSKQKLYDIIMLENFRQFIQGVSLNLFDEKTSIAEKIEKVVIAYIDFLTLNPNLPLFIINELKGNPSRVAAQINEEVNPLRSYFIKQIQEAVKTGEIPAIDPFHFIANLIGLTVFPFISKPLLQRVTKTNDEQFQAFMQERKKLVPIWIRAILNAKID